MFKMAIMPALLAAASVFTGGRNVQNAPAYKSFRRRRQSQIERSIRPGTKASRRAKNRIARASRRKNRV